MEKVLLNIEEVLCPKPERGGWGFLWHLGGVPNLFQSFWSEKKRVRKHCQKHLTYWGLYLVEDSTFAIHCWACFQVAERGAFSFRGILKNSGDRAATLTTRVTDLSSQSVSLEEKGSSLGFELPTCADGAFYEQQTHISFQSSAELSWFSTCTGTTFNSMAHMMVCRNVFGPLKNQTTHPNKFPNSFQAKHITEIVA